MIRTLSRLVALVGATLALLTLTVFSTGLAWATTRAQTTPLASVSVFATGLNNPRGLTFGPDGKLYVAEGGLLGGTLSTVGQCPQVPGAGPYKGGFTSRISKITASGVRTTVVDHLPSSQTGPAVGNQVSGVSDVVFIDGTLYGMEAGAGCSHGLIQTNNTIFRVNRNGSVTDIANLSAFLKAHPVAHPESDDFEPDGTWYSLVEVNDVLYATEPNHQEVDSITLSGNISRLADLSTAFLPPANWQGPTSMVYHNGCLYFSTLGTFPVRPGTQRIYRLTSEGDITVVASTLTAVLGIAFDRHGRLYALETDTTAGFPGPASAGTGEVVRVDADGSLTTIASHLVFPSAMTYGPDGALYVSNFGFGVPTAGAGQIVRIQLND